MRSLVFAFAFTTACGARPVSDAGQADDAGAPLDAGRPDAAIDASVLDAGAGLDGGADAGTAFDAGSFVDGDLDGLDDDFERTVAARYLPVLSLHPQDACPRGGLVYRLRPHPMDPDGGLLAATFSFLFERDCGLTSHPGDNEAFGVTIDPSQPPERGVTVLRAISHQGTLCQRITTCGTCGGLSACERMTPTDSPTLYSSKDKHAGYVSLSGCGTLTCLDTCAMGRRTGVPLVNVGEPAAPLVRDLTDAGFITAANGWTDQTLFHFDPWGAPDFGNAGNVRGDLEDSAFVTPPCR